MVDDRTISNFVLLSSLRCVSYSCDMALQPPARRLEYLSLVWRAQGRRFCVTGSSHSGLISKSDQKGMITAYMDGYKLCDTRGSYAISGFSLADGLAMDSIGS